MGGGACNRKSNLAELKWGKRKKLGQEEVKVGSDWQFLGSALATCHMPHATWPEVTGRVRCGNSKAAATADWANKHTHTHLGTLQFLSATTLQ